VVFPEPAGPVIQITGYFRKESMRRKSRFLGRTPLILGRVILAMEGYFPLTLSLWDPGLEIYSGFKTAIPPNSGNSEYQKNNKSQSKIGDKTRPIQMR